MLGEEYYYPEWSVQLGWYLTLSSVICIPLYALYKFRKTRGGWKRVRFGNKVDLSEIINFFHRD